MAQVALISGGSRGLGLGIAKELLAIGWKVTSFSRQPTPESRAVKNEHGPSVRFLTADLGDVSAVDDVVRTVEEEFGRIDALINNAGIVDEAILARQSVDQIDRLLRTNLRGTLMLTRRAARGMMIRGFGRIVNISSIVAVRGYTGTAAYAATKGGIDAMTRALARELGGRNITVNSIAPGYMDTDMTRGMNQKQLKSILRRTPLGRVGAVEDVAGLAAFLLSDRAAFISGQTIVVDGGLTC